jgi:hypothetical protein
LLDRHCSCGRETQGFQLLGIYLDVFVFGVFEALDNVRPFDFTCFIDILMMHTLVRLAIDLVKLNLLAGISSREDLDRDRNE